MVIKMVVYQWMEIFIRSVSVNECLNDMYVVHDSMVPWFHGSMIPWFRGSMIPWFNGSVVLWFHGSMVLWFHGSMVPWFHGSMVPWFYGSSGRSTTALSSDPPAIGRLAMRWSKC